MPRSTPNSTALLTDRYELTMLASALADGSASRRCTFEVFARGLRGHRYGVVAGVPRLLDALGTDTTLLVDTYDITQGIATAIEVAGPGLRAIRIDSGDLGELARQAREQLDGLGAPDVQIVVSGDLDEYSIAALRAQPVGSYGVGTSVVTGSGVPTAGMVYQLVEVDGQPVAKRSTSKASRGGAKSALRRYKPSGTAVEEVVCLDSRQPEFEERDRLLPVPLLREGRPVGPPPTLHEGRERVTAALTSLPRQGLRLSPASTPSRPSSSEARPPTWSHVEGRRPVA